MHTFPSIIRAKNFLAEIFEMISETAKKKSIGNNFLYSMFITVIIGIVNVVYPLFVGLLYGPKTMGSFSVIFYWAILITIPISNGIAPSISRFIAASSKKDKETIENIGSKFTLYYLIGVLLIYPFVGLFGFKQNFVEVIIVLCLLVGLATHYLYRNSLQGQEEFKSLFFYELISIAIFIPFMLCFSALPVILSWNFVLDNINLLFIPMLAFHLTFGVIIFIKRYKQINIKSTFSLPKLSSKIFLYGLFIGIGGLFAFGTSKVQVIISDLYLIDFELGVLSFWDSAIAAITIFTVALGGILVPRITNLSKSNEDNELAKSFVNSINWSISFVVASLAGFLFLLFECYPVILDFLTLNKYNMVNYWLVVVLLCFKEVNFLLLTPSLSYVLSSEKYVKFNPLSSFVYSIGVIISWIVLVPNFGIIGFAAGIAIGSFAHSLTIIIFVLYITKLKVGLHFLFLIPTYLLNITFIVLIQKTTTAPFLITWGIATIASLGYGIYNLLKILKKKEYSQIGTIHTKEDNMQNIDPKAKNEKSKISTIFMALACPFIIDPRVKQEVNTLSKKGYFVDVLSWDREGKYEDIKEDNFQIKYVKLLTSRQFSKLLYMMSAALFQVVIFIRGMNLLRKHGCIIVHANDFNTIFGVFLLKLIFPNKIKTVYDSHELTPAVYSEWYGEHLGSLIGKIECRLISYFDEIITVSPPIVKHLKQISGNDVSLIWNYPTNSILPKITKAQARKILGFDKETFLIAYVGTLRHDIALVNLIEAISKLKKKNNGTSNLSKLKVAIVGDGPLYVELEEQIKYLRLENLVEIVGRVDRQKSLTYLRAADLSFILFTIKGMNTTIGMPWKLFESLVSSTPVMVVDNTYAANLVRKYDAGYIVNDIDSEEISSTLSEILARDKPLKFDLSNLFLWENQEEEYIKIYESLSI